MNEQAQLIEFIEEAGVQPAERPNFALASTASLGGRPKLRYLVGAVKPNLSHETKFADVVAAVPSPVPQREFIRPAVWPRPAPQNDSFLALQRWEGTVIACGAETFLARLSDLTADGPDEEVELLIEDVSREDRDLIEVGAVFYWAIGYLNEASGGRSRISSLRFRRLPVWSASELEAARDRAIGVAEVFARD